MSAAPAAIMKTAVDRFSSTNTLGGSHFQLKVLELHVSQANSHLVIFGAGAASGVFAARYAGFIKGTSSGTVTWNVGSSYRCVADCIIIILPVKCCGQRFQSVLAPRPGCKFL